MKRVLWFGMVLLILVAGLLVIFNRDWIVDWWKGLSYQPSGEMARIMNDLKLTGRGEFLFKASGPKLSESEEFNAKCRDVLSDEMAVLGCYVGGDVFVYNIQSKELDGIRELTTAHELLHAVWARMSNAEKEGMLGDLRKVYQDNQEQLSKELDNYVSEQTQEELYVRAGTEVKNLPEKLEKHYAEIFSDQDLVVGFYDKYIGVFLEIEAEMDKLKAEMDGIQVQIDNLTKEYEQGVANLNAEIASFNRCAETAGCFGSESEFYARRGELVATQGALEAQYNQINALINEYNVRVEKYNADVTRTEKLNRVINSSVEVEGV